jgi:hypothetical protein
MAYYECLPTRLKPLAERTCFSQVMSAGVALTGVALTYGCGLWVVTLTYGVMFGVGVGINPTVAS